MALIEIKIARDQFVQLGLALSKASAIPDPTLEVLGDDRLITSFKWVGFELGVQPAGLDPPQGKVAALAKVEIGHASLAELEANPAATTVTNASATIFVSALYKGPQCWLVLELIRIDVPGRPTTARFDSTGSKRFGRPPVARQSLETEAVLAGTNIAWTAVLLSAGAVTIRVATRPTDAVLAPPVAEELITEEGRDWVIRISPEFFTDLLLDQLNIAVNPPPAGCAVEDSPSVGWGLVAVGGQYGFGAAGSFGLVKSEDGMFGSVNVSVTIAASLLLIPDVSTGQLTARLQITADPSSWDSFRVWLAKGAFLAALPFAGSVLPAFGVAIGGLAIIGDIIGAETSKTVKEKSIAGFTMVSSGDAHVIHQQVQNLPDPGPESSISAATVGPDGLVASGSWNIFAVVTHKVTFAPPGGTTLKGAWAAGFDCKLWNASYELQRIHVTDEIWTVDQSAKLFEREVEIFETSIVVPTQHWRIDYPPAVVDQWVQVIGDAESTTVQLPAPDIFEDGDGNIHLSQPVGHLVVGLLPPAGHIWLHSSAGLRRYEIGAVVSPPDPPSGAELAQMVVNCKNWGQRWVTPEMVAKWLPNPPPFDYGHEPLRQWMLSLDGVPVGGNIAVYEVRDGERTRLAASFAADRPLPVTIEVITDRHTELEIEHDLNIAPRHARLSQRWLLPTSTTVTDSQAIQLSRSGQNVEVEFAPPPTKLLRNSPTQDTRRPAVGSPLSLNLSAGKVAAVHGNRAVIAYPFGGASTRRTQRANPIDSVERPETHDVPPTSP